MIDYRITLVLFYSTPLLKRTNAESWGASSLIVHVPCTVPRSFSPQISRAFTDDCNWQ